MQLGESYHIYNHANGNENLFIEDKNYQFFLSKLAKYILPVCNIYAYCLMPNHFHLMVNIKSEAELIQLWQSSLTLPKLENKVSKCFANLFSCYTQSFNNLYNRMGSLFIPSMKTALIKDAQYFLKLVHYIHSNPVHHQFTKGIEDWKYSSYKIFLSNKETKIERDFVLKEFDGIEGFIKFHKQPIDLKIKTFE